MLEKTVTGASDWRSEEEKEKSHLRTAAMSLFKTWIPEHPEGAAERDVVHGLLRQALAHRPRLTFVSALSTGVDDVMVHEYHEHPLSMQELLVQREGTEAFLDPRNALRVVRRKYGMMTLITRMTGTMEHRNIVAVSIAANVDPRQLNEFAKLLSARIVDSAAEEEQSFRKGLARANLPAVEVLFHSDVVGRRLPVPWEVKHIYALVGRAARAPGADPARAARQVCEPSADRLNPKALRQLALYARDLASELDLPGCDPAQELLVAAREDRLLAATRNLFDEYQETRRAAVHARAAGLPSHGTPGGTEVFLQETADFLRDAEDAAAGDDELVRLGRALDRIRTIRGREFFARISMVSGDMDFESAVRAGSGFEQVERTMATLDPLEGLKAARRIVEPFFRAKALAAATAQLVALGREDDATAAAEEAEAAARACHGGDVGPAFAAALQALLAARREERAAATLQDAIDHAHGFRDLDERVNALMQVVSTLMEAGALPAAIKSNLSRHILGKDVHFWGKPNINSALVEAIVALLPGPDDETVIFLQKVVAHPKVEVRCSVIRTMPLSDSPALRNILLSHLKDRESDVRMEVMERIGWAQDRSMLVYLVNHARHAQETAATALEKRALALNLARLDGDRQLPLFNAFLGHLATEGPGLTDRQKPFKDDAEWALAGLETLYHLNSRNARRLLFNAFERAKKRRSPLADTAARAWAAVKSRAYGEPTLPRSPHDPAWTEDDRFDLVAVLEKVAPATDAGPESSEPDVGSAARGEGGAARPAGAAASAPPKEGLLSRLKRRFFGGDDAVESHEPREPEPTDVASDAHAVEVASPLVAASTPTPTPSPEPERPRPPATPQAWLRFEAQLQSDGAPAEAAVPMAFALYAEEDAPVPLWREEHRSVTVTAGAVAVHLGAVERLPAPLPATLFMGVSVAGRPEMRPRARLGRARTVVQG